MVNEDGAEIEEELHCQNNYCGDREGVIQRRELIFKSQNYQLHKKIALKSLLIVQIKNIQRYSSLLL